MANRLRISVLFTLVVAIILTVAPVLAEAPEAVSPGALDRVTVVEGRCPTFIWGVAPQATAYELVVYRLRSEMQASGTGDLELSPSDEVLYARLPGGATAWQPELADGLEPGGSYVWFVRAELCEEAGEVIETGDWSAARFFEVAAAPSAEQVRQALEILQRWEAANGDSSPAQSSVAVPDAAAAADSGSGTKSGSSHPKSVPTATAAIKGSIPDTTGEVYGVVGLSSSPDGAGVAAANTAGGPDLVIDGTEDGETDLGFYQWGIDRASTGIESFGFMNSIGGSLDLWVQGNVDAIALIGDGAQVTNVDAETLDGVDGAEFATDAEAMGMVAVHAASADHDGRYFTESELSTSGTVDAVHWNNLGSVPSGFADGIDNDTQPSPGLGLIVDGGQIRIDTAAFLTRLSIVEHAGDDGSDSSIAIGSDGLGLISYYSSSFHSLNVAHCIDIVCSDSVFSTLDSYGYSGVNSAIAIGADGLGLISYYEGLQNDLKVAHCSDLACTTATISTVDSVGDVGAQNSIAIGSDGLGLISYYNASSANLKVAHCNDLACASATTPTLDSTGDVGRFSDITIGADGLGLISYIDQDSRALKVARCADTVCSSATTAVIDGNVWAEGDTSIACGVDGLGLVSYQDSGADLGIAHLGIGVP